MILEINPDAGHQNAKKQANQIRYCLEQAEEYFQSAEVATVATRPLLLYYGMASLAWALILFKKTGQYALDKISAEHQSHGLDRPHLNNNIRTRELQQVLAEIHTKPSELVQTVRNDRELRGTFGLLYAVSRLEPSCVTFEQVSPGITETHSTLFATEPVIHSFESLATARLSLWQLLLDIPDMASSLVELGITPLFARVGDAKGFIGPDGNQSIIVLTAGCTNDMNDALRRRAQQYERVQVTDISHGLKLEASWRVGEAIKLPSMNEALDGRLFIYIKHDVEPLPETSAFLAIMFLLGMLVRYYPHIWMYWLERRHPIVEVVEAFLPIARRKYPNLILNNLTGDSFIFK